MMIRDKLICLWMMCAAFSFVLNGCGDEGSGSVKDDPSGGSGGERIEPDPAAGGSGGQEQPSTGGSGGEAPDSVQGGSGGENNVAGSGGNSSVEPGAGGTGGEPMASNGPGCEDDDTDAEKCEKVCAWLVSCAASDEVCPDFDAELEDDIMLECQGKCFEDGVAADALVNFVCPANSCFNPAGVAQAAELTMMQNACEDR